MCTSKETVILVLPELVLPGLVGRGLTLPGLGVAGRKNLFRPFAV
jgi:hypothetical protein